MLRSVQLRGTILLLIAAAALTSPAGKVLHAKSSGGPHGYEDKILSSRSISKRSIDLSEAKEHIEDTCFSRNVTPTAYRLELRPFPSEGHFTGHVSINVTCKEPTNIITLYAHENLHIAHSEVTIKQLGVRQNVSKDPNVKTDFPFNHKGYGSTTSAEVPLTISSTKKEPAKQWYVITLADTLLKGMVYQLDLSFSGSLSTDTTQGFFRASYQLHRTKEERWFAATRMSPTNARRVFPCFDEPEFKTTFEISVAQAGRMTALSNMPVSSTEEMVNETGWSWVHFEMTPPMSTFSVGVAVLDLESISVSRAAGSSGGVSMSVFARPSFLSEVQGVVEKASSMIELLESYLDSPFPLPKLDLVALPHYSEPEAADHWGLIFLRESDFTNNDTLTWRLANEIAQQWIGHATTSSWWCSVKYSRALADHLAIVATNQDKYPAISYSLYYEYSKQHPYSGLGPQVEYIDSVKIRWFFRMLNYTLTENTFRDGIRMLLQNHKYKVFYKDNLWEILTTQAREDQTLPEPITVKEIAESWNSKDRFPVVTVTRDYQDNSASVEQHVFLRERPQDLRERDSKLWYIPLMYLTPSHLDVPQEPAVWMKEERHTSLINLPGPDDFIIINPDEMGMFMVNYDQANWAMISEYLRGSGPAIPSQTRAKLLHDAWNLAYSGELDIRTALNMTLFLEQETERKVWDVVFTMIDHLGRRVDGTDAGLKFEEYSRRILARLSDTLGEPQPDECKKKTKLRTETWNWLSSLGHQPCVTKAREAYSKWMQSEDPDEGNPVHDSNLCPVFRWGTTEEWEFGLQRVINFPATRMQSERSYLFKTLVGCPRQEERVERILNITLLEGNNNFTNSDIHLIVTALSGEATGYTTLFSFLSQNWDEIKLRFGDRSHLWEDLVHVATGLFKTQEGLNMVSELYVTRQGEFGSAEAVVEQSLRTINAEAQWSDQNLPAMESWLDSHLSSDSYTSTISSQ